MSEELKANIGSGEVLDTFCSSNLIEAYVSTAITLIHINILSNFKKVQL